MNKVAAVWAEPTTPWEIVHRRFFDGQAVNVAEFAERHGLDPIQTQAVISGEQTVISPELCTALCAETGMSEGFFHNLSTQYETEMAKRSA
jgi:plasmid maintenance system antidote protein VapI